MRKLLHLTALALCLFLVSCFEAHEEIWINRDNTARGEFTYTGPASALLLAGGADRIEADVRRLFDDFPTLRLDELTFKTADAQITVHLKASTDSALSLIDILNSEAFRDRSPLARDIGGDIVLQRDGNTVDFQRSINLSNAIGLAALAVTPEDRANRHLRYIIHLPGKAGENNATILSPDGRTLTWNWTLGEALSGPINTSAKIPIPIPWFLIATIAIALLLLITFLIRLRKNRPSPQPPAEPGL